MLIYDIEIVNAIPSKKEPQYEDVTYCEGWEDHEHMGVSCVCCYDYEEQRYRVFTGDNLKPFQELLDKRFPLVGFNNINFDNCVLDQEGIIIDIDRCLDLLQEIWKADRLGPKFIYPSHLGYGLDACCQANFGIGKCGYGGTAPVKWQRGAIGEVIDYCLEDVRLTKLLLDKMMLFGSIVNPKRRGERLRISINEEIKRKYVLPDNFNKENVPNGFRGRI